MTSCISVLFSQALGRRPGPPWSSPSVYKKHETDLRFLSDLDLATMAAPQFESPLDRATFRRSRMFGGIDLMSARFVRHSFAPHSHDELMIGVIHAGVKSFRHGRSREYAAPGSLSVVNAGEM